MPRKRPKPLKAATEVKSIARERLGPVPAGKVIVSKIKKSPKHPKKVEDTE